MVLVWYWLGRRSYDNKRRIARWKGIASRFKSTLVNLIKEVNARFDHYNISAGVR